MPNRTCNYPGCGNPVPGKNLRRTRCDDHRQRVGYRPACSVEGCDNTVATRHSRRCSEHRVNNRLTLMPCTYPGCTNTIPSGGTRKRCDQHRVIGEDRRPELLAAATAMTDDCIIMSNDANGRRRTVRIGDMTTRAARAVWIIANGDPGELSVLHRCNGGSGDHGCINIRHLYLGDHDRNQADKIAADRQARGDRNSNAKVTPEQARSIRERYVPGINRYHPGNLSDLATEFGLSRSEAFYIATDRRWTWL